MSRNEDEHRSELVEEDLFILPTSIHRQPGDNSCLYHALSSGLHRCFPSRYFDATSLRSDINVFIATNPTYPVCLGNSLAITISDAITSFCDSTVDRYIVNQSNLRSWGGIIEIAICVVMYSVHIFIFRPISGSDILQATGTFDTCLNHIDSSNIYLLYSGFNHYDSIFDFVYVSSPFGSPSNCSPHIGSTLSQSKSLSYKSIIGTRESTRYRRLDVSSKKIAKKKSSPISKKLLLHSYRSRALSATNQFVRRYTNFESPLSKNTISKRRSAIIACHRLYKDVPFYGFSQEYLETIRRCSKEDSSNTISTSSSDAKAYSDSYDLFSKFVVCAICGIEGSRSGSSSLSDIEHLISVSGISAKFLSVSRSVSTDTPYDVIFKAELNRYFDNGLIRGIDTVCSTCCMDLARIQVKASKVDKVVHTNDLDILSSDDDSVGSDFKFSLLPKLCFFRGLFTGSIPDELVGLTRVEDSMINIYSAITNVSMAGGKHWQIRGGTCYTIINDLTSVAQQLPRMPTSDCIAILRHESTKLSKDYTYRPNRVYRALHWLKLHNHLYKNVELIFPCDSVDWENDISDVDIPFVDISNEEIIEINEGMGIGCVPSDFVSSNPGIAFFFCIFFYFSAYYIFYMFIFSFFLYIILCYQLL